MHAFEANVWITDADASFDELSECVRDGERRDGLTDDDDDDKEGCVVRFRDAMGAYDVRCATR